MENWNKLSMNDKASFIKVGVKNGLRNLEEIRNSYNEFAKGGALNNTLKKPFSYQEVPEVRFDDGGNLYDLGSRLKRLYSRVSGVQDNKPTSNRDKHPRVRENDSPTRDYSTEIENDVHRRQIARNTSSEKNFTPYIIEKEVKIPGVGRTSTNVFDSLAVYAPKVGVPMRDAVGLFGEETVLGGIPNFSMKAQIKNRNQARVRQGLPEMTPEETQALERAAQNASVFRNFGGMYSQFLLNDHEWDDRGWEKSPKYKDILGNISSPYEHALMMYKLGLYNSGDKNHKAKVQAKGNKIVGSEAYKKWAASSPYMKSSKK